MGGQFIRKLIHIASSNYFEKSPLIVLPFYFSSYIKTNHIALQFQIQFSAMVFHKLILISMFLRLIKWNIINVLAVLAQSQLSSTNLVINGNFTDPAFVGSHQYFPKNISGWNCMKYCEIIKCEQVRPIFFALHQAFPLCAGNVIDLNSIYFNQIVTQQIQLAPGFYQLSFNYYYPTKNTRLKTLQVQFNKDIILKVSPQIDSSVLTYYFQSKVKSIEGKNILEFKNMGENDTRGFKINNVSLYRIVDQISQEAVSQFFSFQFFKTATSIPGGRVFFGSFLSFFINLDRYEFYPYHNRLYSYNEEIILSSIRELQSFKGSIISSEMKALMPSIRSIEGFLLSLDFKSDYLKYSSFGKEVEGNNFSNYFTEFLMYSFPLILLLFLLFNLLFWICFKIRFSKYLRPFSLYGIIFLLFLQGNIEEVTFYVFAQLKSFFSVSVKHKLFNILILAIFFTVLFSCFGLYFFFKFHYGKRTKILIETKDSMLKTVSNQCFDKGILPFACGACHQLLLCCPNLQIILLACVEVAMIVKKVCYRSCYEKPALLWISIITGCIRLYFQTTTFLYTFLGENSRASINEKLHKGLAYMLISSISLEMLAILAYILKGMIQMHGKKTNQVQNIKKEPPKKIANCHKSNKNKGQSTKITMNLSKSKRKIFFLKKH